MSGELYNKERKNRYLELIDANITIRNIFSVVSEYEYIVDRDACDFVGNVCMALFKYLVTDSLSYLQNVKSVMSRYTNWCIKENLSIISQNNWEHITTDILQKFLNTSRLKDKLLTRSEVMEICSQLPYNEKVLILGAFEGIGSYMNGCKEFISLRVSNIHGNLLDLPTRTIPISSDLKGFMLTAADEDKKFYKMVKGKETFRDLYGDKDLIIKPYVAQSDESQLDEVKPSTITHWILKISKAFNRSLSIGSLNEAGRMEFIKKNAKELNITPMEYIVNAEYRKQTEKIYGLINAISIYIARYNYFLNED